MIKISLYPLCLCESYFFCFHYYDRLYDYIRSLSSYEDSPNEIAGEMPLIDTTLSRPIIHFVTSYVFSSLIYFIKQIIA